jgi:hypothetical protein
VLEQQLEEWALTPASRAMLARYAPSLDTETGKERQHFLRVIARVYVAGKVNVSLQNGESASGGVTAGSPQPGTAATTSQTALSPQAPSTSTEAAPTTSAVPASDIATPPPAPPAPSAGTTIAKSAPGGAIPIAAGSSRAVSMSETFGRPLVIGYVAFDRPIGPGGALGKSLPTLPRVERRVPEPARHSFTGVTNPSNR